VFINYNYWGGARKNVVCPLLLRLAHDGSGRLEAYRALFKVHLDEEVVGQIRSATNGNFALGSERFQRDIEAALGRRARRGQAGRPGNDLTSDANQGKLL
jgi:hypothetical protein